MDPKLLKGIAFYLGIVALFIVFGTPVFAEKPVPQLIIDIVEVEFQTNTIHLYGENFNNGGPPVVTLMDYTGNGSPLTVQTYSATEIQVTLPATMPNRCYIVEAITGRASFQRGDIRFVFGHLGQDTIPSKRARREITFATSKADERHDYLWTFELRADLQPN